jgi:peptide/nickel transport system substrate-binding protein
MRNESVLRAVTLGALGLVIVLLGVVLVQLNALEGRFITQGQQIRAIGEATDRLAAGGVRVAAAASGPSEVAPPGVKFLHPEVPNFFKPKATHWPPPGANLEGTLSRGWYTGDPKGFNPLLENSAYNVELIANYVGYPLGAMNAWTNPSDWSAEFAYRVEVTDDFKEFTFYLRPGVKWPEPIGVNLDDPGYAWLKGDHPVTAEDFVFSVEMILNPQVEAGPHRNYYSNIESAKAIDPTTLVLRWKKKLFTNVAQSMVLEPLPKFLYTKDERGTPFPQESLGTRFNQHWYNNKGFLGPGPYTMTRYDAGSKIVLTRNEAFPGEKPAIKTIVYPIYTDITQTLLKLKAHELNFGDLMPGQYREEVLQHQEPGKAPPKGSPFFDGRIQCTAVPTSAYRYIGWNADRPYFSDKRVRRAMTMAFDRKRLLETVFVGLGILVNGPFQPGSPANDPSIEPIPYDLAAAKRLLAEAGWTDTDGDGLLDKSLHAGEARKPFEFTFLVPLGPKESMVLANVLRDDLLKIGVKMNIETAEWSLFLKRSDEKNFDAYALAWTVGWDDDLYQIWHSSQADVAKGSNRVGFRNKDADRIIETLRETFAPEERVKLLRAFHRIVADEQPVSFFSFKKMAVCHWKEVENVMFSKIYPNINALPWSVSRVSP